MGGRCFRLCRLNPPAQLAWAVACRIFACPILPNPPYHPPRHPPRQSPSRPFCQVFFYPSFSSQNVYFLTSPGIPKSTQNRLLGQKLALQVDFLVIFRSFLFFLCLESPSGSIFGRCDPSKLCSRHSGNSILTKSRFLEKYRKPMRWGTLLVPKMVQNRRQGDQKSKK